LLASHAVGSNAWISSSDLLTGNGWVKPYFSESDRITLLQLLDEEIIDLGEGDRELGVCRILSHFKRFYEYR
jgi:hypothetical protein